MGMPTTYRALCCFVVVCLLSALAFAQVPTDEIVANQNRVPAGKLENGVLNVHLELRSGAWRPEAEDGPQLFVQTFGEAGREAQIPGPMLRMREGTTIHATVTNKLKIKATVYGFTTRPANAETGVEIAAGQSHEFTFAAGAPGTYYYWARTTDPLKEPLKLGGQTVVTPLRADAYLNGAFIVDPAGTVAADRVFVINVMLAAPDVVHPGFEVVSINGKSYPYTEPLEYKVGDTVRWRIINPSFSPHPMHLHGAFYQVLSLGSSEKDTAYAGADRQTVVTQNLQPQSTMMMEWTPEHVGRWLFHCHFQFHFSTDERVPVFSRVMASQYAEPEAAPEAHAHHEAMGSMTDMAGLVLVINVKPSSSAPERASAGTPRKIDLVIEPSAAAGKSRTFSCSVREGKKIVASEDKAVGPPIVVTRGELTEITVVNHLDAATTIHWHGIELDSYYDGVVGGGVGDQITPAIQPGASFVARFTPSRAGTFIYHTHAADPNQLTGGVYGGLIVLEPGESFDAEHDRLLVIGTRDTFFDATRITVNGSEQISPMVLSRGASYRLRLINMAPNLPANVQLGSKEHPATWLAVAKDGAKVPARLAKPEDAVLHIASGETYDFEFRPDAPGEIPLQIENMVNQSKLVGKIVVQ
jgi:manganese oxidase